MNSYLLGNDDDDEDDDDISRQTTFHNIPNLTNR